MSKFMDKDQRAREAGSDLLKWAARWGLLSPRADVRSITLEWSVKDPNFVKISGDFLPSEKQEEEKHD